MGWLKPITGKVLISCLRLMCYLRQGFSGQGFNTSEIKNKGIEGTLRVKILDGKDFKFNVAGNIAWNRNILSKYSKKRVIQDGRYEGFPLESVFAGRYTGIDRVMGCIRMSEDRMLRFIKEQIYKPWIIIVII